MRTRLTLAVATAALLLPVAANAGSTERSPSTGADRPAGADAVGTRDTRFVELKLKEAARLSLQSQHFVTEATGSAKSLNSVLAQRNAESVRPLFAGSPADLRLEAATLRQSGQRVPDLSQWYDVQFPSRVAARRGAAELSALPHVAEAYVAPKAPPLPSTPDFEDLQEYRGSPPQGVGDVWTDSVPGSNGAGVKIVDLEYSWNLQHEDLTSARGSRIPDGTPCDPFRDRNHGTAVLGELIADDNGFGVTGIVPGADIGVTNVSRKANGACRWSVARAVDTAAAALVPGDVILIEQQTFGPDDELLPVEWMPSAYDAIKTATAAGIVVVEAAGNGSVDLDDPEYGSTFPRDKVDSGAIMVGASGCYGSRHRASFSNYGSRVNLQGWGGCVATTGYGHLYGTDANEAYTASFSGTSSASPIVAGAAAAVLGAHEAAEGAPMSPLDLRELLISTGSPQPVDDVGHIGPLPNLSIALLNDYPPAEPSGLTATGSNNGVRLTWAAPSESDVASYTVSRARVEGYGFTEIATIGGARTAFLDKKARAGVTTVYRLVATDVGNQRGDFAQASGVRTGPGLVQQDQATYAGAWQLDTCACFSGGSAMTSTQDGASAEFKFTGSEITIISTSGPDHGAIGVYINGHHRRTLYPLEEERYLVDFWTKRFETSATRTLTLVVRDYGGDTRVDIDAFAVKP